MIKFGQNLKEVEKRLPLLVEVFSKRKDILAMYLFGSRATNTADNLSDIDIALLLEGRGAPLERELDLIGEITSILGTDEVSLVILNSAPLVIRYGVIKESKVLYSTDENSRFIFEENVIKKYFDFKYYLDRYDNEFISILKHRRLK